MIKFFRRIRHQLFSENKFSKYLLYALGEIVLVVIGILIALQLNQIQQEKKERTKELSYLNELHLDFSSNQIQLDSIIKNNTFRLHACRRLNFHVLQLRDNYGIDRFESYPYLDSMMFYQNEAFKHNTYTPKNGTIQAIMSSSTFDLIQNDSLRRLLISWSDVLEDYQEEEKFTSDFLYGEYEPWVRSHYKFEDYFAPVNVEGWVSDREYNYRIIRAEFLKTLLNNGEAEGLAKTIDEIIRLTEKELTHD